MKINIEKSQIWTPLWTPFAPHFFIIGPINWNFHTICKIEKETLFVPENFSI